MRSCGPSANFAICGFPYLRPIYFLQFADFQFADHILFCNFRICNSWTQVIFADLKLPQIRKYIIILLTNIRFICSHSMTTFGFWDSFETELRYITFRILKYTYIGKKKETNADLDQKHCVFFPCKFADLRFADWDTKLSGFAVWGLGINYYKFVDCDKRTGICGFAIAKWAHVGLDQGPRATYILCIEHLRLMRLSRESNPAGTAGEHSMQRAIRTALWTAICRVETCSEPRLVLYTQEFAALRFSD